MGKIVKFCAACDESFAEKFAFCPNCGQVMSAFEMNPLAAAETKISDAPVVNVKNDEAVEAENNLDIPAAAPVLAETLPNVELPNIAETQDFSAVNQTQLSLDDAAVEPDSTDVFAPKDNFEPETKTFAATAGTIGNDYRTSDKSYQSEFSSGQNSANDGYHITVIEEKNVNQRNGLLLATMILMVTLVLGATVFSLFNRDLLIGAIDQDNPLYVSVIDELPMDIEEQPKKDKDNGGGGGGGGKDNPQEATKGRLPNQVDKPIMPPQPLPQVTNASLPNPNETQGKNKRDRTTEPVGLLNGVQSDTLSSGRGSGGGIGGGNGTGIGGGNGTGEGNGNGSGSGNGNGNGNGNGKGDGSGNPKPPPPPVAVGPTEGVKILSRPKPPYTDSARQNQVTGTVRLRVTFTANGQIGSVSPVSGLPYGLTEQAIAAAKQIRFEPAKKNGVPILSVRVIEYTFSIY